MDVRFGMHAWMGGLACMHAWAVWHACMDVRFGMHAWMCSLACTHGCAAVWHACMDGRFGMHAWAVCLGTVAVHLPVPTDPTPTTQEGTLVQQDLMTYLCHPHPNQEGALVLQDLLQCRGPASG